VLSVGIAANFVLALSVPYAAFSHRLFAGSYVVVVAVHTTLSVLEDGGVPPVVLATTAVVNGAAPTVVVIAALVAGDALMAWWAVAAVIVMTLSPLVRHLAPGRLSGPPAFTSRPERSVQRHSVLLLILLGEAVLTIGVGLGTAFRDLDREQVLVTLTSFAVAGTLYYAYFGERDDDAACRALSRAAPQRRTLMALLSFGYAFALMLLGVDFTVAGVHQVSLDSEAVPSLTFGGYLAAGVGAYWVGLGLFRLAIGRSFARSRIVFGLALGVFAALGRVSGLAEMLWILAGSVLMLVAETAGARRRLKARAAIVG
jgi:low temperature requirement protein LtrA